MALNKQLLDIPFFGTIHQEADAKILKDGDFTDLINCEFQKTGAISKRAGYKAQTMAGTDIIPNRILYHDNQLLAAAPGKSDFYPNGLFTRNEQQKEWVEIGKIPEATMSREFAVRDNTGKVQGDMTIAGAYKVYAWVQICNDSEAPAVENRINLRIIDRITGAQVFEGIIGDSGENVKSVKCATSGTVAQVSWIQNTNSLKAIYLNCIPNWTPNPYQVPYEVSASIDGSTNPDGYYDVCGIPYSIADGYTDAYRFLYSWTDATTKALFVTRINCQQDGSAFFGETREVTTDASTNSAILSFRNGTLGWQPNCYIAYYAKNAFHNFELRYKVLYANILTNVICGETIIETTLTATALGNAPIGLAESAYIPATYRNCAVLTWGYYDEVNYPTELPSAVHIKWNTIGPAGERGTGGYQYRLTPVSKPWYQSETDKIYQWVSDVFTNTHFMVELPEDIISGTVEYARPVTHTAYHEGWAGNKTHLSNVSVYGDSGTAAIPIDDYEKFNCVLPVFPIVPTTILTPGNPAYGPEALFNGAFDTKGIVVGGDGYSWIPADGFGWQSGTDIEHIPPEMHPWQLYYGPYSPPNEDSSSGTGNFAVCSTGPGCYPEGYLYQDGYVDALGTTWKLEQGKTYRVEFDIFRFTMGRVRAIIGGNPGQWRTATGVYSQDILCTGTLDINGVHHSEGSVLHGESFSGWIRNFRINEVPTDDEVKVVDDLRSLDEFQVYFNDPDLYDNVDYGGLTYLSGGILMQYDGSKVVENGFIQEPYIKAKVERESFGAIPDGYLGDATVTGEQVYSYVMVAEWVDAKGNKHQSAPTDPVTVTLPAAGWNVDIWFAPITLSYKLRSSLDYSGEDIILSVYRTEANGSLYYRRFPLDKIRGRHATLLPGYVDCGFDYGIINEPSYPYSQLIAFRDGVYDDATDDKLRYNEQLYCSPQPKAQLANDAIIGGCKYIYLHKNRIFAAGGENPRRIYYSKELLPGEPASFSLYQYIDVPVVIKEIHRNLDALMVFGRYMIFAIFGDGPDATGDPGSGSFTPPVIVSDEIGLMDSRSITCYRDGIIFRSDRGFMLLTNQRSIEFIGEPIKYKLMDSDENTNGYTILDTTIHSTKSQIRFLLGGYKITNSTVHNQKIIMFDYYHGKWSEWQMGFPGGTIPVPGATLRCSAYNNGVYTICADSELYDEDPTKFQDGGGTFKPLSITTGWMSLDSLQGFKRLWYVETLGELWGTPASFVISIDRNWRSDYNQTKVFSYTTQSGNFWARTHVKYQLGTSWRFAITEGSISSGSSGASFNRCPNFTGITLEYGTEGGLLKELSYGNPTTTNGSST
jgi:hypothetical protein